jgi:hypothetical protein
MTDVDATKRDVCGRWYHRASLMEARENEEKTAGEAEKQTPILVLKVTENRGHATTPI